MSDAHWRNSMKPARFGPLDARSAIPVLFLIMHFRLWTLCLTLLFMVVFWAFERRGLTFPAALRAMRVWLLGPRRPAVVFTRKRRMVDVQDWVPAAFGGGGKGDAADDGLPAGAPAGTAAPARKKRKPGTRPAGTRPTGPAPGPARVKPEPPAGEVTGTEIELPEQEPVKER